MSTKAQAIQAKLKAKASVHLSRLETSMMSRMMGSISRLRCRIASHRRLSTVKPLSRRNTVDSKLDCTRLEAPLCQLRRLKHASEASVSWDMDVMASVHVVFRMIFFLRKRSCSGSYVTKNPIDIFANEYVVRVSGLSVVGIPV